jgi:amidase
MSRRDFLRLVSLGGAAAFTARTTVGSSLLSVVSQRGNEGAPLQIEELSISRIQRLFSKGELSSVSLTKKYLARIEQIDRRGPALNSVIELNPDAIEIARACDKQRVAGEVPSPLHGIPVLIKDNIDTHDRMTTTAGSLALKGSIAPRDSGVAEKLRAAGAVIVGKTNLSEWANFRGSMSTSGWSGRGGQTRNPYVLDRNPSGSSSGSAVAVSANLCTVAVGTETDGSILSPASFNGIVGLKPTVGLISRAGIIPISQSQDTAGPMTRTVLDAAILLAALAGVDPRDPATASGRAYENRDYCALLTSNALRGSRLGIARAYFGFHPKVDEVIGKTLTVLRRCGAELVDPVGLRVQPELEQAEMEVLRYEMKAGLNTYLTSLGPNAPIHSLQELIAFNERFRNEELPWFGQEELVNSQAKGPLTEKAYRDALAACRRFARAEGIDRVMDEHRLDALVAPTAGPAHVTDWLNGDHALGDSTTPAAVAGYPSITVPAGFISGLPVGISFFGRAWSEPKLLAIAYGYERATAIRRPPAYIKTVSS